MATLLNCVNEQSLIQNRRFQDENRLLMPLKLLHFLNFLLWERNNIIEKCFLTSPTFMETKLVLFLNKFKLTKMVISSALSLSCR